MNINKTQFLEELDNIFNTVIFDFNIIFNSQVNLCDFFDDVVKKSKIIKKIMKVNTNANFIDLSNIQTINEKNFKNSWNIITHLIDFLKKSHIRINFYSDNLSLSTYIQSFLSKHECFIDINETFTINIFVVSANSLLNAKHNINEIMQYLETHDIILTESIDWFKYVSCNLCLFSKMHLISKIKLFNYSLINYYNVSLSKQLIFVNKPKYNYCIFHSPYYTNELIDNINNILRIEKYKIIEKEQFNLIIGTNLFDVENLYLENHEIMNIDIFDYDSDKIYKILSNVKTIIYDSKYDFYSKIITFALYNSIQIINLSNNQFLHFSNYCDEQIKNLRIQMFCCTDIFYLTTLDFDLNINTNVEIIDFYENKFRELIEFYNNIGLRLHIILLSNDSNCDLLFGQNINFCKYGGSVKILTETKIKMIKLYMSQFIKENVRFDILITEILENQNACVKLITQYFKKVFQINFYYLTNKLLGQQIKIFINYKPLETSTPYGGGNQFVKNIIEHLKKNSNHKITFELDNDENSPIDIYFIIDIRKGTYKKYSYDEILRHKNEYGNNSKIIYRINDCDYTRQNQTLETLIMKYLNTFDMIVFNSKFIADYYIEKYDLKNIKYQIIYNTANSKYFFPKKHILEKEKWIICTHHWSDNILKGYEYYYKMFCYCNEQSNEKCEFKFYGRKFNEQFSDVPVLGPYADMEMGNTLRNAHIYITGSIYDACPMHLLEALSCGLPILYYDHYGGVKDICELNENIVGEPFYDFETMISGLNKIVNNYEFYCENIKKNINLYNSDQCVKSFTKIFYFM